jgi:hypothetical protein
MALVLKDRVKETTTTQGTGTITLLGAVQGYQGFSSIGNGNTTYYCIQSIADWEVGIGTVGAGSLTRDTVLASSNNGSLVGFGSGVKDVFCTYPADKSVSTDSLPVTIASNTTSPNNTIYAVSISPSVSAASSDTVIAAKGFGGLLAQVPNSAASGGNKRGSFAVDWQRSRVSATQVASGSFATISGGSSNSAGGLNAVVGGGTLNDATGDYSTSSGGYNNNALANYSNVSGGSNNSVTAAGQYSAINGGADNVASGSYSSVGGGQSNTASATYAAIAGGRLNVASAVNTAIGGGLSNEAIGTYATVAGGELNVASGSYSAVLGGYTNTTSGAYAVVGGGQNHQANSSHSAIFGGAYGSTRSVVGYHAFPACLTPVALKAGASQGGLLILGAVTISALSTILRSNTSSATTSNQLRLPFDSAYYFKGSVIAAVEGGDSKSWTFDGQIKKGLTNASTTLVGSTVTSPYGDAGASTWTVALSADTTNGCLAVTVTGQASTTIRWACKIETTEVTY